MSSVKVFLLYLAVFWIGFAAGYFRRWVKEKDATKNIRLPQTTSSTTQLNPDAIRRNQRK